MGAAHLFPAADVRHEQTRPRNVPHLRARLLQRFFDIPKRLLRLSISVSGDGNPTRFIGSRSARRVNAIANPHRAAVTHNRLPDRSGRDVLSHSPTRFITR